MANLTSTEYGAGATILFNPAGWDGFAQTFSADVHAGDIFPANDGTAKGVVLRDYKQGETGTVVHRGNVDLSKLPSAPSAAAKAALPSVHWFPGDGSGGNTPYGA